jgi:hypothetical protein
MPAPRSTGSRTERSDTKTLVRLGQSGFAPEAAADDERPSEPTAVEPEAGSGATAVRLWFKGLPEPVRARAELGDASLELKAELPFLELGSVVGFTTDEGDARSHGRIRRVRIEIGPEGAVPCLRVELGEGDAPARLDPPVAAAIDAGPATNAASSVESPEGAPVAASAVPRPASRVLSWLAALAIGAGAGAGATYAFLIVHKGASAVPAPASEGGVPATNAAAIPAELGPSIMAAFAAEQATEQASLDAAEGPSLAAYEVQAPLRPEEVATDLDGQSEESWAGAAVHDRGDLEEDTAPVDPPADLGQQPEVTLEGVLTSVFVPMRGEGAGLRQYELTTPGVAVTVPRARALIAPGNYPIVRGLVRRVWVRQHGEGVQVRVITRRAVSQSRLTFDEHGLRIALTP